MRLWIALSATVLVGCTASSHSTTSPPPRAPSSSTAPTASASGRIALHRPLDLPRVSPGSACPLTAVSHSPDPAIAPVLGTGPAGPVGMQDGVLDYVGPGVAGGTNAWSDLSWGGMKVLWAVDPAVPGDVLVRGGQLDGAHEVRFEDPAVAELVLPAGGGAGSGTWRDYPGFTRLQAPGCYGYQVDTAAGTTVIVFRAYGPFVVQAQGCQAVLRQLAELVYQSRGWPPLATRAVSTAQRAEQSIRVERDRLTAEQRRLTDRLYPFINSLLLGDTRKDAYEVLRRGVTDLKAACGVSPPASS